MERMLTGLQKDLRQDQANVGLQRDALEAERRQIAVERRWDSIAGPAITGAAILFAAVSPLVLCFMVLRGLRHTDNSNEVLCDILVDEFVAARPRFLGRSIWQSSIEGPHFTNSDDAGADF